MLVIGGDDEALDKVEKLRRVGARVTVVAESASQALRALLHREDIPHFVRPFVETDLQGVHLVMLTEQDAALAERLRDLKRRYPFWLCALDQPDYSDIFLVSVVRRGPLQVGISTGGGAPLLARRIREGLERGFDNSFAEFARKLTRLRRELRELPKAERSERLSRALDGFAVEVRVSYPVPESEPGKT